ncbi:hypothetical protein FRB90_000315 [Tulasnella sp. 427]|nr:hypothetical protein FRB90_000315 [Tulasnella sp. 427]
MTATDGSKQSTFHDLTDFTFQRLHGVLGHYEALEIEPLQAALQHRSSLLKQCYEPFPRPSDQSRKSVQSGKVTLRDGAVLEVVDEDKEIAFEISKALNLDEVEALTLLRLFLYSEDIPPAQLSDSSRLIDAISDFYYDERLYLIRTVGDLLRVKASAGDNYNTIATEFVQTQFPDQNVFIEKLLQSLAARMTDPVPEYIPKDVKSAAKWAKQNLKEQLCLLEVIFWSAISQTTNGNFVLQFFQAARQLGLGRNQRWEELLMDEECGQLLNDLEVLFGVTAVQLLELDKLLDEELDLELAVKRQRGFLASPKDVEAIHTAVSELPDDQQYAPLILSWGYVVSRIARLPRDEIPQQFEDFYGVLNPPPARKARFVAGGPLGVAEGVLNRAFELGVFGALRRYTNSPLLSTALAAAVASKLTEPNNAQFRYIIKGILMAILDSVQVEYITDYDTLVEVWAAVFGSGEMPIVVHLCSSFWTRDVGYSIQRRSLLDLSLSRFPVEIVPLIRLLRSMSGTGGLVELDSIADDDDQAALRASSARYVFEYFSALPTYAQVLPPHLLSGPDATFDTRPHTSLGYYYTNIRPVRLPGGCILPPSSVGRVISNQGAVVVSWSQQHSGWDLLLDILRTYQARAFGGRTRRQAAGSPETKRLELEDIGLQVDSEEVLVAEILDLFRCLLYKNLDLTSRVVAELQKDDGEADLIQVTLLILKDALVTSTTDRGQAPTRIVASALGVLTALLPVVPGQIWPFLRSLPQLFGDGGQMGSTPLLLDVERSSGSYGMTLALLDLVGALFDEAFRMVLTHNRTLQQMKTDVLLRALNFIHSEIWEEHVTWRYVRVADRFEIGRKIGNIYAEILKLSPPVTAAATTDETTGNPLAPLTRFVLDTFVYRATSSTINPLVSSISTVRQLHDALQKALRFVDASNLDQLLEANLVLTQLLLVRKHQISASAPTTAKVSESQPTRISLLEQTLFNGVPGLSNAGKGRGQRSEPVDVIAGLVQNRSFGPSIATIATHCLSALCASASVSSSTGLSLVAHLSDPEAISAAYIRILSDPYEEIELRKAVWDFISIVVDTQPALAALFISGKLKASEKGVDIVKRAPGQDNTEPQHTALSAACDMLASAGTLWDVTPSLHNAALTMLDLVWQHALEHLDSLTKTREDPQFWQNLAWIASKDLGEPPANVVTAVEQAFDVEHTKQSEIVSNYSHHSASKAHALHVLAMDLKLASPDRLKSTTTPKSFDVVLKLFKDSKAFTSHMTEATRCSFAPRLHAELQHLISNHFPTLTLDSVRVTSLPSQRTYGDHYLYQSDVVHNRLMKCAGSDESLGYYATLIFLHTCAVNLDWSLTDSEILLTRSWETMLQEAAGWLRTQPNLDAPIMMSAAQMAKVIAEERRGGDTMQNVHADRLSMLEGLLNVAWLSTSTVAPDPAQIAELVRSVRFIATSESFPPLDSLRRRTQPSFHRTLLRIVYCCAHKAAQVCRSTGTKLEQRLAISADVSEILGFVVDAMRSVFDLAYNPSTFDLSDDLKLLVAVFEKCTKTELHSTPSTWLARCQEVDLLRASLEVLVRSDLVGRSQPQGGSHLPSLGQHILYFHIVLARLPASAERLAQEGVITAYQKVNLAPYLQAGAVTPISNAPPGEYSSLHRAWCTMLGVSTSLTQVLGTEGHFLSSEIVALVQLFGAQLTRALGWTIDEPLTFPLVEEIHRVVRLFQATASCAIMDERDPEPSVQAVLGAFAERSLLLLQQLNYVLSHPNHLVTLLEPVSLEERMLLEKEVAGSIDGPVQMIDSATRPLIASLVQRLLIIVRDAASTLLIISKSDWLFCVRDDDLWRAYPPQVAAETTVSATGPVSIASLRELATFTLDVLKHCLKPENKAAKAKAELVPAVLQPFDAGVTKVVAAQAIEQILLFACVQLRSSTYQPVAVLPAGAFKDSMGMDLELERSNVFGRSTAPAPIDPTRMMRNWRELAFDLNLVAKEIPSESGPGTKEFKDQLLRSTSKMVQELEKKLKEGLR